DAVDDQILAPDLLVRQAAARDASDDWLRIGTSRIIDRVIGRRGGELSIADLAVERRNDVAAFAHRAKRLLQLLRQAPHAFALLSGQSHPAKRCEPTRSKTLFDAVEVVRGD